MTPIKFEVGSQRVDAPSEPRTQHAALLLGYGQVNQAVAACLERERDRLRAFGCEVAPSRALVRDLTKRRGGPYVTLSNDVRHVIDAPVDIVIEALGGIEPARSLVTAALEAGIPVVSANKTLVAAHGRELRRLAAAHGTRFACDAAVLAGVPFLGSLERRPLVSAATRIEAILNGTTHFVMSAIARGATFDAALADATARGYAEPDSRADISGRDAAEKLTVLLHLAGCDVVAEDLPRLGIDAIEPDDLAAARRAGGDDQAGRARLARRRPIRRVGRAGVRLRGAPARAARRRDQRFAHQIGQHAVHVLRSWRRPSRDGRDHR